MAMQNLHLLQFPINLFLFIFILSVSLSERECWTRQVGGGVVMVSHQRFLRAVKYSKLIHLHVHDLSVGLCLCLHECVCALSGHDRQHTSQLLRFYLAIIVCKQQVLNSAIISIIPFLRLPPIIIYAVSLYYIAVWMMYAW